MDRIFTSQSSKIFYFRYLKKTNKFLWTFSRFRMHEVVIIFDWRFKVGKWKIEYVSNCMTYSNEFIDILLYSSTNIRRVIELTHLYNQSRDLTLVTKPGRVNTRGRYVRHLRFVRIFCQLFVYFATILCVIQMNPKYIKLLF